MQWKKFVGHCCNKVCGNRLLQQKCCWNLPAQLHLTDIRYCLGLVCLFDDQNKRTQFVIWNPFIRRYRISPKEFISNPFKLEFETKFTFGYDVVNDDYEVLRVVEFQKKRLIVKMYSLNMHSWKKIQEVWPATNLGVNWSRSVYVNGSLHWLLL